MLVKVGFNREEISSFDEATQASLYPRDMTMAFIIKRHLRNRWTDLQRRKPSRMEQMKEYIIAWRRGRVELYEEWVSQVPSDRHVHLDARF